jgi:hypothetical protein
MGRDSKSANLAGNAVLYLMPQQAKCAVFEEDCWSCLDRWNHLAVDVDRAALQVLRWFVP